MELLFTLFAIIFIGLLIFGIVMAGFHSAQYAFQKKLGEYDQWLVYVWGLRQRAGLPELEIRDVSQLPTLEQLKYMAWDISGKTGIR